MRIDFKYRFRFISHYFRARSKFDIHSPFVYRIYSSVLIDKAEYPEYKFLRSAKGNQVSLKTRLLLFRLVRHFNPAQLLILGQTEELVLSALRLGGPGCRIRNNEENPPASERVKPFGMILISFDNQDSFMDYFPEIMQQIGNDSVFIFQNIYNSEESMKCWNDLKDLPGVTVSLDLFHLGMLFFRQELSKEEFILRF